MRLKLTFRLGEKKDIDLMVDEEQKILETTQVLMESGILDIEATESIKYVKSLRTNRQINVLLSYKEGQIYTGDIIELRTIG